MIKKYFYSPPKMIKDVFSDFIWDSGTNKILFTFDDGPNPNTTELILRTLEENSIKAIFFCVGENLQKYPELVNEILSQGHEIGNHTFSHEKITSLNKNEMILTINRTQKILEENFSYTCKYFRPPHGRFKLFSNSVFRQLQVVNVMWSLLTYDYKNEINIVKFALNNYLAENSVIVLHDNIKSSKIIIDSINIALEIADKKKYQIGKPSECLRYFS